MTRREIRRRYNIRRKRSVLFENRLPEGYTELSGIAFAADCYFVISGFRLRGSDTLRFSFSATKTCNVLGCYTSTDALTNFSLYASTTSGSKYMRYNGGTANGTIVANTRYDLVMGPTGSTGLPVSSTWTQKDFEAESDFCVGTTSTSATSSKFDGTFFGDIVVDGRLCLVPAEDENGKVGYYDTDSGTFYEPSTGTPTPIY